MDQYQYTTIKGSSPDNIASVSQDEAILLDGLGRNILQHLGNVALAEPIRIFLRDRKNKITGGICGSVFSGWLYISLLWIEESLRNKGYGSELLKRLETEAMQLGCRYAHVDTYGFEARPFYERSGYEVFATLEEYPAGHYKYFLRKTLIAKEKHVSKGVRNVNKISSSSF